MKRIEDLNTIYNIAIAVMYESIILCVIGIVIYTSAAYHYINRNICLETAVRFIHGPYRCQFSSSYADAALKEGVTCTNKCNVQIHYLNNQYTYYVSQVHVKIGNERTFMQSICDSPHMAYLIRDMYIKCSSWNKDKYTVMNTTDCQLNSAQCERIDNYCICHCYPGYSIINGSCLKENVTVGNACFYSWQCRGTKFASVCNHNGRCECQAGYILNGNSCFEGNVTIGKRCVSDLQCTGTQYASLCQNALCSCRLGYVTYRNSCSLGIPCHEQF
ncbi:uncharacterized protein LOC128159243 [Crassostrea angulata]|uniref:uncharacterized protein LOC128159243 n=1 Tax=Magallana angulata TaxID=2784310 RepID=UPI0022B1EC87|nr:uncharacterized protein LOC128159243 [Crassostrea angulata]